MSSSSIASPSGSYVELDRATCLSLLASVPIGRVVHTERALPAVTPVNFRVLPDGIYVRTSGQSALAALGQPSAVVAFEADAYDVTGRYGWSVIVLGRIRTVTDLLTLDRLRALPLETWAGGERECVLRLPLEMVSGRRVGGPVRSGVPPVAES